MCRRYKLSKSFREWVAAMSLPKDKVGDQINQWYTKGVNTPENHITTVTNIDGQLHPRLLYWGVNPFGHVVCYHARSEKLFERPWAELVSNGRVLVPCDAWREGDGVFTPKSILNMAGLADGNKVAILTTDAKGAVRRYHNRQPLLLNRDESIKWVARNSSVDDFRYLMGVDHTDDVRAKHKPAA